MDLHTVCCSLLLLLTCSGRGFGQVLELPESINKTVGENVVITPKRLTDPPHRFVRWNFNTAIILSGPPNGVDILPPYKDRVSFNTTSLALELRSLTESDTGQYVLSVDTTTTYTAHTSLLVLVPVSSVTIVPSQTELVENNTVSFVCSASGSSLSFIWLNGSSEITAGERVQLTDNNSKLTITSVMRGDTGTYECEAYNSISRKKSLPFSLMIYYGGSEGGDGDSLPAEAIARIVIGVLLVVAANAGLIFYFVKVKEMPRTNSRGNNQSLATHNAGGHDSQYENILRFHNSNTEVTVGGSDTQMPHTPHPDTKNPFPPVPAFNSSSLGFECTF
ncbi:carcinoembryonic antigen-related cell adhesion molecule 1-like isoform X2 [Tachysurus fulvidraco]|uniref:carcinoembryonic antigen-related cell adhesion molecule 1-like isoform X2 n=1 Tax=Tachysurus fulvidraco TaxID=1234273 RepID=UPI001FED47D8|nr:carcinoembryonic antigen-related cell adhesion molecule 1-like isoform X2 [Tachysurus fulvidraco]